jgi:hypothetical protein
MGMKRSNERFLFWGNGPDRFPSRRRGRFSDGFGAKSRCSYIEDKCSGTY